MKIIYTRPDGGVSIIGIATQSSVAETTPEVGLMTEQQFIDWVKAKDVPADATNVSVVQDADAPAQPASIPSVLSMRQARLALLQSGRLAAVETLITGMDEAARITWNHSSEVRREHPLVSAMAAALPLTGSQLDELFTLGATL